MIDLTEYFQRFQVGFGIMLIILLLFLTFFAKFPDEKN